MLLRRFFRHCTDRNFSAWNGSVDGRTSSAPNASPNDVSSRRVETPPVTRKKHAAKETIDAPGVPRHCTNALQEGTRAHDEPLPRNLLRLQGLCGRAGVHPPDGARAEKRQGLGRALREGPRGPHRDQPQAPDRHRRNEILPGRLSKRRKVGELSAALQQVLLRGRPEDRRIHSGGHCRAQGEGRGRHRRRNGRSRAAS